MKDQIDVLLSRGISAEVCGLVKIRIWTDALLVCSILKMSSYNQTQLVTNVAYNQTQKLRTYFSKHKDKTTKIQKRNAIYPIPCKNCEQHYIGQTSKKIETRLTEHKNAINRYDLLSYPASHTHDNGHTFNWTETQILDQAKVGV